MEFFDSTKSIVENLYLLCGPLLTILATTGVIQIIIAKKALVISSKRDAANLAAQQLRDYGERIIPTMTKYDLALLKEKILPSKMGIGEFNRVDLIEKLGQMAYTAKRKELQKFLVLELNALNALEGFSTYFTKGVADEQIAYSAIGRTFCASVEGYYFVISDCRPKNDSSCQNIIELYKIWSVRLQKDLLTNEQEVLLKQLSIIKDKSVDPIGTK